MKGRLIMSNSSLTQKLQLSLSRLLHLSLPDLLAEVREIQTDFRSLSRPLLPINELVSLKYQMQHWKQRILGHVLDLVSRSVVEPQDQRLIFALLAILELKPTAIQLKLLARWVNEQKSPELKEGASFYFAQIAEHALLRKFSSKREKALQRLAGPRINAPIYANAPSRWPFEKWVQHEEFQSYQFEEEGVRYRGIGFLPGDVLLTNVNRDGNGVYTAVVEPRAYAYHLGIFAMIEHEGRILPVVLETYKLGVRAIPLSCFLAGKFSSYVEVYRVKERPVGFSSKINSWIAGLPGQTRGYNFDTEDTDRDYLSCTTIGRLAYEQAGGPLIATKSRYIADPQVQKNLAKLDFTRPEFFSLSDFVNDPAMTFVGVVDNNHFEWNIARELCERYFVEFFRSGELQLSRLPVLFWLNRFGIRQMRAGKILGRLIGFPYGLTQRNLPKGPEKVLAVVEIYEHLLARSVRRLVPKIAANWNPGQLLEIDTLLQTTEIQALLSKELRYGTYGFLKLKSDS